MDTNLNSINSSKSLKDSQKSRKFLENTKKAVRNTLTALGIAASTILPMTSASLLTACGGGDGPDNPIEIKDTTPPTINVSKSSVDISGGKEIRISGNQLYIGNDVIASWSDNKTKNCSVLLSINGKTITSGTTISEEGILTIKVSDEAGNIKSADIKLNKAVDQDISGLENLKNLNMQVDQEVNLLDGVTFGNGASLEKVEIEIDGQRVEVTDPYHYIPAYPGVCNIIISVKDKNGKSTEYKVDNLTIKALEYKSMEITNINPETLMPKVEVGDKDVYKHIEHLRIPESTVITDMMWKYGAGNYSPEEYQQLMMRLNTGMLGENPVDYDNYEAVGGTPSGAPSNHAHAEWFTLNTLVKHANFKVINSGDIRNVLYTLCRGDPNKINIMGVSIGVDVDKNGYDSRSIERDKQYDKEKNRLVFCAGGNIRTEGGRLHNKIYQEDIPLPDEHSVYSGRSRAHGKNDNTLDRHLLITFGTNEDGDIDQTNEEAESSKFPVGFHDKVLFSGHAFSHRNYATDKIRASTGKYATSHTNFVNVAIADLCFQMKADVSDVDELLEMIRSTALTDHIRFDLNEDGDTNDTYQGQPETQPLLLMNPAGFFKKYLMPTDLPSNIQASKTATLNKGYYKGVIFDIPGAEVKINGQWIVYNDANKSQIISQNPMNLEWRINGDLCKKLGYKGKTIQGKIIVVDDKWNGLNIDKDFSMNMQ